MSITLTEEEQRTISDLLDDGMALSAEKIGLFSKTTWDIVSASVKEVQRSGALAQSRGDAGAYIGAKLKSRSLMPLEILVLFPESSGRAIAAAVARTEGGLLNSLPNRDLAILGELSNILGQGLIAAMVDWFKVSVILTVPQILQGEKSTLVEGALADFKEKSNTLLISHIQMNSPEISAECTMMLIFDTAVIQRIIKVASSR